MIDFFLTALISILFVVDPPGAIPTYLVISANQNPEQRRRTALRASIVATLTLAAFAGGGQFIFHYLGLTLPAFQIAGGLILFLVALDMIRAQRPTQEEPGEVSEGLAKQDVAVTPLAIPMLAGPAAMASVSVQIYRADSPTRTLVVFVAIAITGTVSYITLRLADLLYRGLGRTGIHIFSRILGLILAGVSVQFVLDGLRAGNYISAG
ncbi:MAG: MarC family protein [Phycisphaerae bacterium]|nr:MarC family protein [Phycisphaerae bacterium]